MLRTISILAFLSLGASPGDAQGATLEPFNGVAELERSALIAAVLERNPNLEAARQAVRAAGQRAAQAPALDELRVAYGFAPRSLGGSGVPFGQEVEVSQALPYPGKRRLRGRAAAAEADQAREDLAELQLELATHASLLFDDDYAAHRAIEINSEHVALLEDFQRIATARYAAGFASQQDPLQAEAELAHRLHDGVLLRSRLAVIGAEINALLHRAPEAPLPPPPADSPAPAAVAPDAAALTAAALERRPDLRRGAAMVQARQAELELARLTGRPDLDVKAAYNSMWSDTEHRLMLGVSVSLPVWRDRVRAAVDEAEARLAQAQGELAALEDDVRRSVFQAATRWREAHHVLEILRDRLLPAASDQVHAALSGFRSGRNDFLALIDAERGLRSVKLEYHEALADLYRRRAELDAAVGIVPGGAVETHAEGGA